MTLSKRLSLGLVALAAALVLMASPSRAAVVLYNQNFENPTGFVNDAADVNIFRTVNQLYGNQPAGFTFAQDFTVETLLITGTQAFGTGYSDPSGKGGNYALGMLASVQNDLLGLSFDVGTFDFLNVSLDISSIDLSAWGGPFVFPNDNVPEFEFTLFDNPGGGTGLNGNGTILARMRATGTASPRSVFDWTNVLLPMDASQSTNGKVTLRIDLLRGGYAAMDNFRIVASNVGGDLAIVPEPSTILLAVPAMALMAVSAVRSRRRRLDTSS
jgi:hypothetical protein